jgi:hypothetical protein
MCRTRGESPGPPSGHPTQSGRTCRQEPPTATRCAFFSSSCFCSSLPPRAQTAPASLVPSIQVTAAATVQSGYAEGNAVAVDLLRVRKDAAHVAITTALFEQLITGQQKPRVLLFRFHVSAPRAAAGARPTPHRAPARRGRPCRSTGLGLPWCLSRRPRL